MNRKQVKGISIIDSPISERYRTEAIECLEWTIEQIKRRRIADWKIKAIVVMAMRITYLKDKK